MLKVLQLWRLRKLVLGLGRVAAKSLHEAVLIMEVLPTETM
jgi:hypothetical protein